MNFKDLKEETIGLANQTFAETYEKIFRDKYNNSFDTHLFRNYNFSDVRRGEYHAVIPTTLSPEGLKHSDIIIKVLPSVTQESAKIFAEEMHKAYLNSTPGVQDSELIVLVAAQRHGWTRGFKHINNPKGGYLTAIFVADDKNITSTNELWRKVMQKVIMPFFEKRIKLYLDSFNLLPKLSEENVPLTNVYYRGSFIIDSIDYSKSLFVKGISHFLNWLNCKVNWFAEQFKAVMITRQTEKEALKHCKPMRLKLKIQSKRELIEKLKRSLENDIAMAKILDEHKIQLQNEKVPSDPSEKYIEYLTAKVKTHG